MTDARSDAMQELLKNANEQEKRDYEKLKLQQAQFNFERYNIRSSDFDNAPPLVPSNDTDGLAAFDGLITREGGSLLPTGFYKEKGRRFGVDLVVNADNTISMTGYSPNLKDMKLLAEPNATKESVAAYKEYAESLARMGAMQGVTSMEFNFKNAKSMMPWKIEILEQAFKKYGIEANLEAGQKNLIREWRDESTLLSGKSIGKHMTEYLRVMAQEYPEDFKEQYGDKMGKDFNAEMMWAKPDRVDASTIQVTNEQSLAWKNKYIEPQQPKAKTQEAIVREVMVSTTQLANKTQQVNDSPKFVDANRGNAIVKKLIEKVVAIDSTAGLDDNAKKAQKVVEIEKGLKELDDKSKKLDEQIKEVTKDIDKLNASLTKEPANENEKNMLGAIANVAEKELAAREEYRLALVAEQSSLAAQAQVWRNEIDRGNETNGVVPVALPRVASPDNVPPPTATAPEFTELLNKLLQTKAKIEASGANLVAASTKLTEQKTNVIEEAKEKAARPTLPPRAPSPQ